MSNIGQPVPATFTTLPPRLLPRNGLRRSQETRNDREHSVTEAANVQDVSPIRRLALSRKPGGRYKSASGRQSRGHVVEPDSPRTPATPSSPPSSRVGLNQPNSPGRSPDATCKPPVAISRASHVEPDDLGCWWADLSPVKGPRMGPFERRSEALSAEQGWLKANWLLPQG